MDEERKPILCLDFDGVLHWYREGWKGPGIVDDKPVPGARDFVRAAMGAFEVVIYSSRCRYLDGKEAIKEWLKKWGFPEGIKLASEKPAAFLTLDDRAFRFQGEWPSVEELLSFKPWNAIEKRAVFPPELELVVQEKIVHEGHPYGCYVPIVEKESGLHVAHVIASIRGGQAITLAERFVGNFKRHEIDDRNLKHLEEMVEKFRPLVKDSKREGQGVLWAAFEKLKRLMEQAGEKEDGGQKS